MTNSLNRMDGNLFWQIGSFLNRNEKEALFRTGRRTYKVYIEGGHFQRWIQRTLFSLKLPLSLSSIFRTNPEGKNSWRVQVVTKLSEDSNQLMNLNNPIDPDSMLGILTDVVKNVSTRVLEGHLDSPDEVLDCFLSHGNFSIEEALGIIETMNHKNDALERLNRRGNLTPQQRLAIIKKIECPDIRKEAFKEFTARYSAEQTMKLLDEKDTEFKEICVFHSLWSPEITFEQAIRMIDDHISPEQKHNAYLAILDNKNIFLSSEDLTFFYKFNENLLCAGQKIN